MCHQCWSPCSRGDFLDHLNDCARVCHSLHANVLNYRLLNMWPAHFESLEIMKQDAKALQLLAYHHPLISCLMCRQVYHWNCYKSWAHRHRNQQQDIYLLGQTCNNKHQCFHHQQSSCVISCDFHLRLSWSSVAPLVGMSFQYFW